MRTLHKVVFDCEWFVTPKIVNVLAKDPDQAIRFARHNLIMALRPIYQYVREDMFSTTEVKQYEGATETILKDIKEMQREDNYGIA